jgi:hypothetical protein
MCSPGPELAPADTPGRLAHDGYGQEHDALETVIFIVARGHLRRGPDSPI